MAVDGRATAHQAAAREAWWRTDAFEEIAATLIAYLTLSVVIATVVLGTNRQPLKVFATISFGSPARVSNSLALLSLYAALARGSVIVVSPLVASYPIVTMMLSAIFLLLRL